MAEIKMIDLKVVIKDDEGEKEIEIKEPDTKYWDALKKLLEENFTSPGTRVAQQFSTISNKPKN